MTGPEISIVVLPFSGRTGLVRCLDALEHQEGLREREVIVPHDDSLGDTAEVSRRFDRIVLVSHAGRKTPAALRASGVAVARADVVALLEDHCVPDPHWTERMLYWIRQGHSAVGGAVEKGFPPGRSDDTALDWAVYMTDYSRYMGPAEAGPVQSITDTNSAYRRNELEAMRELWQNEFHENVVNDELRRRGRTIWFAPDAVVREQRSLSLRAALADRLEFGRLFASTRVAGATGTRRAAMVAASVLMPPVLVLRVARTLLRRRKHRRQFVRVLPHLALVTSAWMAGEMAGYVTGRPGKRLASEPETPGSGKA